MEEEAPQQSIPVEPPQPPKAVEPPQPNPLVAWITGGNAIARVGIVVLFIGIAFLIRHAVVNDAVPREVQLGGVGIAGLILLIFGWRLRDTRTGYALTLQGAGIGILYLAVYGAFRLHEMIPAAIAFPLLVAIAILATWLAIRQDAAVLAGFGAAGGFLAPVLSSTGQGDHVLLFGYYAILNLAVLATAWFRSWRSLNLIGFVFTFVIGLAWGYRYYQPENFATVEPFLVFFFLLYVAVAIFFARLASTPAGRMVDATIVFGAPLVGFAMQSTLVNDTEYGMAWSSFAVSVFYFVLAGVMHKRTGPEWRLLERAFIALGIVFATITIPLAVDPRWTSAAWAIEGAAVAWYGARQKRPLAVLLGVALQILSGPMILLEHGSIDRTYPFLNHAFLGAILMAAAGLVTHLALRRAGSWAAQWMFIWALVWWLLATFDEAHQFLPQHLELMADLSIMAATALLFAPFHRRYAWTEASWPSLFLLPAMIIVLILQLVHLRAGHPFAGGGWIAWPFAVLAHLMARHHIETAEDRGRGGWISFSHAGLMLLLVVLGSWELHWQLIDIGLRPTGWLSPALVVVPSMAMVLVSWPVLQRRWPIAAHPWAYQRAGVAALAVALWIWVFVVNALHNGKSAPLPYIPGFNSVDLGHLFVVVAFMTWLRGLKSAGLERPPYLTGNRLAVFAGLAGFAWANGVLLRSLHHWFDVPYRWSAWEKSFLVQASLSIFWSALALAFMVYAVRRASRAVWMVGAALMGVVVLKLVTVDLANLGGLERIASFIGVGVLMLAVGYFAPVPPRAPAAASRIEP
ncbi:DUF2339 domain-containing protein [Usitatibacter palustris]|uniref:DUF2339 domain-containing protein n=1 Tax=Usitatibacter palustris TaxID=2732487 RepID=UPI00148895CF|nr:DUF2339 domain-containing protein [Usitatibacter palustris]